MTLYRAISQHEGGAGVRPLNPPTTETSGFMLCESWFGGSHADAEARRSVLTALACATLVTPIMMADLHARGRQPRNRLSGSPRNFFFFFITLDLELSDTKVYEP